MIFFKIVTFFMCLTSLASSPSPKSHEINQALDITGQSRGLSMGLLFEKQKDKLSFGTPRVHYKDKLSIKKIQF